MFWQTTFYAAHPSPPDQVRGRLWPSPLEGRGNENVRRRATLLSARWRHDGAAFAAGAVCIAAVEAIEDGREIGFDVLQREVFLVKFVVAILAKPQQAVLFAFLAAALD